MLVDLEKVEAKAEPIRSQICIVGAGLAGLSLAHRLAAAGIDVALLEAGGRSPEERSQSIYKARMARLKHDGTHDGRFRLLGGSTTRWGGQLLPYTAEVLQPQPSLPSPNWPLTIDQVMPFYPDAERFLRADELPYEATPFFNAIHHNVPPLLDAMPEVRARFSKCAPFSRRNVGTTVGKELESSKFVTIYLHANLTELLLARGGDCIEAALVRNYAGTRFRFEAAHFVLCAGTVETSRLLLSSRSVHPAGVGNSHDQVGRFFHDHISLPSATLNGEARRMFLQSFGPFIFRRTAHTVKLEAAPELRGRLNLLAVMAHIIIKEPEDSGVHVARSLLRSVQRRDMKEAIVRELPKVFRGSIDLGRLAFTTLARKRRYASPRAAVTLCLDSEQLPLANTRIRLDDDHDALGMPKTVVDWSISDAERWTLRKFASFLRERFDKLSIRGVDWRPEIFDDSAEITGIADTFHPMGGCRMGTDPRESVVDPNLTVHGIGNLSVASAAVYPAGGSSNPSFTLIALTFRLADQLASKLHAAQRPANLTEGCAAAVGPGS